MLCKRIITALLAMCLLMAPWGLAESGIPDAAPTDPPSGGAEAGQPDAPAEAHAEDDPLAEMFDWIGDITGEAAEDAEGSASGLEFGDGVELDDEAETLRMRFELRNADDRTITGCWVLIYGTDDAGTVIYGHDDGGWWTETELPPGGSGYTEYVDVPDDERITALHTLVLAVAYADGGEWELDTSNLAEAEERGLVANWDVE